MKQKLFNKFFITMSITVLLSLTIMMMILTIMYNRYLSDTKYNTLQQTCEQITKFIELDPSQDAEDDKIYYSMRNLSQVLNIDIYITDEKGTIEICSCDEWILNKSCEHTGISLDAEFVKSGERRLDDLGIYDSPHYCIVSDINSNSAGYKYVVAVSRMSEMKMLMRQVAKIYCISAVVPVVLMFFALYCITYRMTKPLKLMSNAAKAMAKGDFSKRIPVTSDDEIGELAVSFNQMTNSLTQLEGMRKDFIANVSHELKTPMTTIGGFIDGIIDDTIEPEKQKYYLGIVSGEVKRLSRMVETMLNLSRLESGEFVLKKEHFDFRELLLNIVISQERRIDDKKLDIQGLDNIPSVTLYADRDLLYRVIYNLVDNAVKFNCDDGYISFEVKTDSKKMIFRITNSGKGIPSNQLPYVFERFYKVDKSRSANKNSTGLGLYIVKTIVKNHGGNITVSSRENEFTTFEVALPLTK